MHNHFDHHLSFRQHLVSVKPSHVVECGAGTGELTRKIATLQSVFPFDFTVITDSPILCPPGVALRIGVSYHVVEEYPEDSIDYCIIDTDHNYWTLIQELNALHPKLREGGWIALHDVGTFYYTTGMAESYADGSPYPSEQIVEHGKLYGGLGCAAIDWLASHRGEYRLERWVPESQGAALIQKSTVKELAVCVPGPGAIYAGAEQGSQCHTV